MLSEPMTLYKLMILYMLKHVNFPLSSAQLADFFLENNYTNYSNLHLALNELKDSALIHAKTLHNSTRYEITEEGDSTLSFFHKNISPAIIEDIEAFLNENRYRMRTEVSVMADYYKSANQDFIVHCVVREGTGSLIELDISVPDRKQAESMCVKWQEKNQEIYAFVMKALMTE